MPVRLTQVAVQFLAGQEVHEVGYGAVEFSGGAEHGKQVVLGEEPLVCEAGARGAYVLFGGWGVGYLACV
jgi:hypothetical protein